MAPIRPYAARLGASLDELRDEFVAVIEASTIAYVNPNRRGNGTVHLGVSNYGWAPSDTALQLQRSHLAQSYEQWFHRFTLLFPAMVPEMSKTVADADGLIRRWLERENRRDRSIPKDVEAAVRRGIGAFEVLRRLVEAAAQGGRATTYLVPDTNALVDNPDLADYAKAASVDEAVIYLVPTVLGELDELKVRAHQDRRDAANRAIWVIKGLRERGNLASGVSVAGKVTAQVTAVEPDVRSVLSMLDPSVPDDRIVASGLKLQSAQPASVVVLVTSDISLTTKADLVGLPVVSTPKRKLSARRT